MTKAAVLTARFVGELVIAKLSPGGVTTPVSHVTTTLPFGCTERPVYVQMGSPVDRLRLFEDCATAGTEIRRPATAAIATAVRRRRLELDTGFMGLPFGRAPGGAI
jgi:hypothetical protein